MAVLGYDVVGLDVDPAKIDGAAPAEAPFFEPGWRSCSRNPGAGSCGSPTTSTEAARAATSHFICVGTPQRKGELAADLSYVDAAVDVPGPRPAPAGA